MGVIEAVQEILFYGDIVADAEILAMMLKNDNIGGRSAGWSNMSIMPEEGQVLYLLTRVLRPAAVLEVGTHAGCSSCHILQGMKDNNKGFLYSVDLDSDAGSKIPFDLKNYWRFRRDDVMNLQFDNSQGKFEMIFEDSAHELEPATAILTKLKECESPLIISHDAVMDEYYAEGFQVRQAFEKVFGPSKVIVLGNKYPGLIYHWRKNV